MGVKSALVGTYQNARQGRDGEGEEARQMECMTWRLSSVVTGAANGPKTSGR